MLYDSYNLILPENVKNKDEIIDIGGKKIKTNLKNSARRINIELSTLKVYNNWYEINDELYYFKSHFAILELIMSEIFKSINISALDYKIVFNSDNNFYGIISKNFRRPNSKYVTYKKFLDSFKANNLWDENISKRSSSEVYNKLLLDTYKIMAVDVLFGQIDRCSYNVTLEIKRDKTKYAPMYDNGLYLVDCRDYKSCFKDLFLYSNESEMNDIDHYDTYIFINKHKEFVKSLIKVMDIDLNMILKETIEKYNLNISSELIDYILEYFDCRKELVNKTLSLVL